MGDTGHDGEIEFQWRASIATKPKMNRKIVDCAQLPALNSTYSQAIHANGFVFISGQIGIDPSTGKLISDDIGEQTRQTLDNISTILKAAGTSLSRIVSVSLYLTEFDQLSRVNAVYTDYFGKEGPTKFSCGVSQLYTGAKIEIVVNEYHACSGSAVKCL